MNKTPISRLIICISLFLVLLTPCVPVLSSTLFQKEELAIPTRQAPDTSASGEPDSLAVGDFSHDGKLDLVVNNIVQGTNYLCTGNLPFLINNDNLGNFTTIEKPSFCSPLPFIHKAMASSDFNKDGSTDLILANYTSHSIVFMPGDAMIPWTEINTGNNPTSLAIGDLDEDSLMDIVTANYGDNNISVILNNGRSTFQTAVNFSTDRNPVSVVLNDFDGDGLLDIATANEKKGTVSILKGDGAGNFGVKEDYVVGLLPSALVTGDFNGDGKGDLAIAHSAGNSVSLLMSQSSGSMLVGESIPVGLSPVALAVGDFNQDGIKDFVAVNKTSGNVSVMINQGGGTFDQRRDFAVGEQPVDVGVGDFDGDGKEDIVVANAQSRSVTFLYQRIPGDVNLDNKVDLFDLRIALQAYLSLVVLSSDELSSLDVRPRNRVENQDSFGDGRIGGDDLNWLLRKVLGLERLP